VLIVKGDLPSFERALPLLERLLQAAEAEGRAGVQIEALALQALAYWRRGEQVSAMTALERALRLAESQGYLRLFADLGLPMARHMPQLRDGYEQPIIEELDLKAAGINTVIWAIGYSFDYSLVKLPIHDQDGFPIQTSGVTGYAGLYFVGMPWMPTERSGFLIGVGESARQIAANIAAADTHR
jgi:MalT-like TPR region